MFGVVSRVGMEVPMPMAWIAPLGCRAGPVAPFGGLAGGAVVMMAAFWVGVWDGGMDESRAARIGSLLKLNQAFGERAASAGTFFAQRALPCHRPQRCSRSTTGRAGF